MCTSVASRVQGTTGEPCASEPWWARMMCSTAWARSGGKPSSSSITPAHAVVAERDLALQAARVGHVDRRVAAGVGLELADVVQQRAGDGDVAVDPRERRADRAHRLGDRERVLEQPVQVGLVVVLGGRRDAVRRPRLGSRAEERVQQPAQVRVLHGGDELAQVGLHLLGRTGRSVEQVGHHVAAFGGGRSARTVICGP